MIPISTVAFEIIEKCNLTCDFCVRNAHRKLTGSLDLERFARRLSKVRAAFGNLSLIALTGGEPFIHPELGGLIEKAMTAAAAVCITTNGTVLREEVLAAIAAAKRCHLIFSLDGPAEIHDKLRGMRGAFDKLARFTLAARARGIPLLANITVTDRNVAYVRETACIAAEQGAVDISVALVKPAGRGGVIPLGQRVLTEAMRQVHMARQELEPIGVKVHLTDPLAHLLEPERETWDGLVRCGAGSGTLHVQVSGAVLLCTACKESLGEIEAESFDLKLAFQGDARVHAISAGTSLGGACGECELVRICAGCRCRAGSAGDFLGGDPLCPRNRQVVSDDEVEATLRRGETRMQVAHARDPAALEGFLRAWLAQESFTRANRDFTGQRRWGHNWRLDDKRVIDGEMGWRHIEILRSFLRAGALPLRLHGLRILDIGPWTGGEALLLAALGAHVEVLEESSLYRETIEHLAASLDLDVIIRGASLYELERSNDLEFDAVYLSGILSHLTDPIVGLRLVYGALKEGGVICLETQTSYAADGRDEFWGPERPGWIWWNMSRGTLLSVVAAAGFTDAEILGFAPNRRIQLAARRQGSRPLAMRMGVSRSLPVVD